jgi:glycosyltransferase involved in cell wall biosynthesis
MHIVQIHHTRLPVAGYGGQERVVVWLARGLAELGHKVTVVAPAGTKIPEASVIPVRFKPGLNIAAITPCDADILHYHFPVSYSPGLPSVWTLHGNLKPGEVVPPTTICVSANHAERHGGTAYVHNGIDPAEFVYRANKSDYDLFLGRLHSVKGYQLAIEGARRTRRKLVVAGGWRPSLSRWVQFVGSVDGAAKAEWLAGARLLWMPAQWDEPCGLTLLEALMSGTPLLGTHRGALPEIISEDVGGMGDTLDELVDLIPAVTRKDPEACRARAIRCFSHLVMAEEYLRLYRQFLATGTLPAGRACPEA